MPIYLYETCFYDSEVNKPRRITTDDNNNVIEDTFVLAEDLPYDLFSKTYYKSDTYIATRIERYAGSSVYWKVDFEEIEHYEDRVRTKHFN